MRFLKLGAAAMASAFLATGVMAPAALAQQPVAVVSKAMGPPVNEAQAAIAAKDWATAAAKLNAAYALAKTPNEKLAVEQLRVSVAANANDWALLIKAVGAIETLNLLPAADMKAYRGVMPEAYKKLNDTPNALKAQKAYFEQYGGTNQEMAVFAQDSVNAGDHATAITYIDKAIAGMKSSGAKAPESFFRVKVRAVQGTGNPAAVYDALGELVVEYPKDEYWAQLVARTQDEPNFGASMRLDMYRALLGAGVKLTAQQKSSAGNEAIERGLPNEALLMLEAAVTSGELTSEFDTKNLANAKTQAPKDKAGLAAETADALAKGDGATIARIGEAQLSYGDNAKAAEVLQAALAKGIADAGKADIARLHLGIAQLRSGDKDAARATWATVKADNGAGVLAQNWILISKAVP